MSLNITISEATEQAILNIQNLKLDRFSFDTVELAELSNNIQRTITSKLKLIPDFTKEPGFLKAIELSNTIKSFDFPKFDELVPENVSRALSEMIRNNEAILNTVNSFDLPLINEKTFKEGINASRNKQKVSSTVAIAVNEEEVIGVFQKAINSVDWKNPLAAMAAIVIFLDFCTYVHKFCSLEVVVAFMKWFNLTYLTGHNW